MKTNQPTLSAICWMLLAGSCFGATYQGLIDASTAYYGLQDDAASTAINNANGADGTLTGAGNTSASSVVGPTAWLPKSLSLDGSNDYVQCGDHGIVEDGIFTFAVWAKTSSAATLRVITEGNATNNTPFAGVQISGSDTRGWLRNDASSGTYASTTPVNDGEWHLLVQTSDGTNNRIYIDGVLGGSTAAPSSPITVTQSTIGALARVSIDSYFDGQVAGAVFSDDAWTQPDIAAYMAGELPATSQLPLRLPIRLPVRVEVQQ